MKIRKLLISIVIVSLLVSMALPMASAKKPENPGGGGGGGKEEPPADPVIAVVTPTGRGYNKLVVMNSDGSNRVEVYDGSSLNYPSWSPDGSSIAFTSCYWELWTIDVDLVNGKPVGSNPTLLLGDIAGGGGPEWSPGGPYEDHILFVGDSYNDLEVISTIDRNIHILYTADPGHTLWYPVWSPGGDKIAFMEWDGDHYALNILDLGLGEVATVVEPFIGNNLDWARHREIDEIAYSLSHKVRNKYVYELYTVDIGTGITKFLFNGKNPTWSPEDKLCFEYRGLVVHDFGTGESKEISNWGYHPDWSRAPPKNS